MWMCCWKSKWMGKSLGFHLTFALPSHCTSLRLTHQASQDALAQVHTREYLHLIHTSNLKVVQVRATQWGCLCGQAGRSTR